mgnify:CR=1 FL=1
MNEWNGDLLSLASQDPKVSDPNQSLGQDMHGEPSDKLQIIQTHLQLLGAITVVFIVEGVDRFAIQRRPGYPDHRHL